MAFTKVVLTGTRDVIKAAFTRFNTFLDDLLSTTSGKGASQVGIQDSAGYMDADNVEDALAEVYADVANPRSAWDTLDENVTTTTGLTWGFLGGLIRIDNSIVTVTAGTISLTDDATNYIEIQTDGTVSRNTTGFTSGRIPLRQVVCASGAQSTSTDKRAWFQRPEVPLPVAQGGSGLVTLTNHGILLGSGTSDITPLAAATNGQLPIGKTSNDPTLATLTGTSNQITITNGAGSITLSIPSGAIITFANAGIHILESGASPTHDLIIQAGSALGADRILTLTTGDAARTITLSGNPTLADWFDQAVKAGSSPTFSTVTIGGTAIAATGAEITARCDDGAISRARAYLGTANQVTPNVTWVVVQFNTETYDNLNEFDNSVTSGTADQTEANKLHDADGGFTSGMVGATVWNTTDNTYTNVAAFVDSGELTLDADIIIDTETYKIFHSKFTATAAGYYLVTSSIEFTSIADGVLCGIGIYKNTTVTSRSYVLPGAATSNACLTISDVLALSASDSIEIRAYQASGGVESLVLGTIYTYLTIHRLS